MEFIFVVEDVTYLVYFKEGSITLTVKCSAQIGNLVLHTYIALLLQHTYGGIELIVCRHLLFLYYRYHTIAQVEPSLSLIHQTDGKDRCRTAEGTQMTSRLTSLTVGDDTLHTKILSRLNSTFGKIFTLFYSVI